VVRPDRADARRVTPEPRAATSVLVGLERRHIIEDADEVFAIIRGLAAPIVPSQIPPRLNGRLWGR
jgi:hypothetical protein